MHSVPSTPARFLSADFRTSFVPRSFHLLLKPGIEISPGVQFAATGCRIVLLALRNLEDSGMRVVVVYLVLGTCRFRAARPCSAPGYVVDSTPEE